jgi:hypothetical protein
LIPRPPAWDLRDRIAAKFNIHLQERSVGMLLKLDFGSISVRPMHQTNLEAQEAFKKTSPTRRGRAVIRETVSDAMKADSLHYEAVRIGDNGASSHANAIDYRH